MYGRIIKAKNKYELIYPILIAKKPLFSNLIINSCHSKCKHLSIGTTVTKLRFSCLRNYQLETLISKCHTCKNSNSQAFKYLKLTNLQKHRVKFMNHSNTQGLTILGIYGYKKMGNRAKCIN